MVYGKLSNQIVTTTYQNCDLSLVYQLLFEDCYQNHGELTTQKLNQLALFSEKIEEPRYYGKFQNEQHYLDTLHLVLGSTLETRNRVLFFLRIVVPEIQNKENLLDIGPGDAALTLPLAKFFQHLTAVDLNHQILNTLKDLIPATIGYLPLESCILKAELSKNYYDLVVMSHNLYYIDAAEWLTAVKKTYSSLRDNGWLVIVLGGDELDKADLIRTFGGKTLEIDQLAVDCKELFGEENVELYASEEVFLSSNSKTMLHIAAFMLCDAKVTAPKEQLSDYIDRRLKVSEHLYKMTTLQKFIVIRKI